MPTAAAGPLVEPLSPAASPLAQNPAAARVVTHVESLIGEGTLRPGDRLPPERDLALQLGVSRPTIRAGLRWLAAMGVVRARQGSGTFITDGPPRMEPGALGMLASLHRFTRDEMFEARRVLEVGVAGLAAERATPEHLAAMADELTGLFAALDAPQTFLVRDVRFHRAVAAGSGNPVLAALVELVSALVYDRRRLTVERATDLKEAAEMHRRIYAAIRARAPERARREMEEHLDTARLSQLLEGEEPAPSATSESPSGPAPAKTPRRSRRS
jgi:GntR family transcriptional regulator, transcriptional repressor for pyruvate dehydrogenase complex